jgi:hypothetical protein
MSIADEVVASGWLAQHAAEGDGAVTGRFLSASSSSKLPVNVPEVAFINDTKPMDSSRKRFVRLAMQVR